MNNAAIYSEAHTLYSENKLDRSIARFNFLINDDPENPKYRHDIAYICLKQGMAIDAIHHLKKALHNEPMDPKLWLSYATCLYHLKKYDDAIQITELAVSKSIISQKDALVLKDSCRKQLIFLEEKKYDNLYNDDLISEYLGSDLDKDVLFEKIIKLTDAKTVSPKAYVYLLQKYFETATEGYEVLLDKVISIGNVNADLHIMRAKFLLEKDAQEEAIHELEKAIEIRPTSVKAYRQLFQIYMHLNDLAQITIYNRRICSLAPHDEKLMATIIFELFQRNLFGACFDTISAIETKLVKDSVIERLKACCLIKVQRYDEGAQLLGKYLDDLNHPELLLYAQALLELHRIEDLKRLLKNSKDDNDPSIAQIVAKLAWKEKRWNDGLVTLRKGITKFDFNVPSKNKRVYKKFNVENADQAIREALYLFKRSNVEVWLDFGTLLGYVREGHPLTFDKDCDLGTKETDVDKVIEALTSEFTFRVSSISQDNTGRTLSATFVHNVTHVTVDVFIYHATKAGFETGFNYEPSPVLWHFDDIPAVEYKKLNGLELPCLTNSETHLETVYGKTWRIPDPYFDTVVSAKNLDNKSTTASEFYGLLRAINNFTDERYDKCKMLLLQVKALNPKNNFDKILKKLDKKMVPYS